jgi:hypothetical protein
MYVNAEHLVMVKPGWIHAWSARQPGIESSGLSQSYSFGAMRDGWFVRTAPVPDGRAVLPLDETRRRTRFRIEDDDLCAGESCAVRLRFQPARFDAPAHTQAYQSPGWQAMHRPEGLVLIMGRSPDVFAPVSDPTMVRRQTYDLTRLLADFRVPQRDYGEGILAPMDGVYAGAIRGHAAPAPTSVPIVYWRRFMAWRRGDGGLQLWFPHRDAYAPPSQDRWPWLVNLAPTDTISARPSYLTWQTVSRSGKGWPQATPERAECRCHGPPCDPYDAPRHMMRGPLPFPVTVDAWTCDRPNARRQWSLRPLGLRGRVSHLHVSGKRLAISGPGLKQVIRGQLGFVDLSDQFALKGKARLRLEPLQNGALAATLGIERRRPLRAPSRQPFTTIGPPRRAVTIMRLTSGWQMRTPDGRSLPLRKIGNRFRGAFAEIEVQLELLSSQAVWVYSTQKVELLPIDM